MDTEEIRKKENKRVLEMMRNGENLSMYSIESTWFPERPQIKKDFKGIKKIHRIKDNLYDFNK